MGAQPARGGRKVRVPLGETTTPPGQRGPDWVGRWVRPREGRVAGGWDGGPDAKGRGES